MRRSIPLERMLFFSAVLWTAIFLSHRAVQADPSKYPQFAQQKLADNITPVFIAVDELVKEITAVKKT